jgi:hypothetical protein
MCSWLDFWLGVENQLVSEGPKWLPSLKVTHLTWKGGFTLQDIVLQTYHAKIPVLMRACMPTIQYWIFGRVSGTHWYLMIPYGYQASKSLAQSEKQGLSHQDIVLLTYYTKILVLMWACTPNIPYTTGHFGPKFRRTKQYLRNFKCHALQGKRHGNLRAWIVKEAYTMFMCGHHHPQCSASAVWISWPMTICNANLSMRHDIIRHQNWW